LSTKLWRRLRGAASYVPQKQPCKSASCSASLTVSELEQSKTTVLNMLASAHSRRSYKHAIEKFIAWYCSEPRLGFNRSVVVRYRSFLEGLSLSAATINLHLSSIRRLADEAAESGWLSPELAIGIRRVKGRQAPWPKDWQLANWRSGARAIECRFSGHPARQKRCSSDRTAARMWSATLGNRELTIGSAAIEGKPLGDRRYGWKRRTTANGPVPEWCKGLIDVWIHDAGVTEGKVFRRVSKNGTRQDEAVTTDVVWYAVKRYAKRIGIDHLAPHDLRRTCARLCHDAGGELEQIQFLLGHASVQTTERYIGCRQNLREAVNDRFRISPQTMQLTKFRGAA
jgi:hypothetical protein